MKKLKKIIAVVCVSAICIVSGLVSYAQESVNYDFSKGFDGKDKTAFVTRGEFCHYMAYLLSCKDILADVSDTESFSDVSNEHSNYNDIIYLKKLKIIKGVGGGTFRPDDYISYQEAATMMCRVFKTDSLITSGYGEWPYGYIRFAHEKGLFNGVSVGITSFVTIGNLYNMLDNLDRRFVTYELIEKLGCDTYNGKVYIDYYPKHWQGFEERPFVSSNGYFKILPAKLLYSYDNETWHTLYEDIDGKRQYENLPSDIDIEGARYAWQHSCFVNAPFDINKHYYSYDNKTWYAGVPEGRNPNNVYPEYEEYIMGIEKGTIISDAENGIFYSIQPYSRETYYSKTYEINLGDTRIKTLWVSEDGADWYPITGPEEMLFFSGISINRYAKAVIIDGAVEFNDEENAFLDNEEKIAAELGLGYDRPKYKQEKYIVYFDEIKELLK